MKIDISFKDINCGNDGKVPIIQILWQNHSVYHGEIKTITFDVEPVQQATLEIEFANKTPDDTICDQHGQILYDMNFSLDSIAIDHEPMKELMWDGDYISSDGNSYSGCLFFGPAGRYQCQIKLPLLRWRLERNHRINGNDPDWQRDYEFYQRACKILQNT